MVYDQLPSIRMVIHPWSVFLLGLLFVKQLVLSSVRIETIVLSPRKDIKSGIFAYQLTITRDFEIIFFAKLITLTPRTLLIYVSKDRRTFLRA